MEKELTQEKKDRIVKHWQERMDEEFKECQKRIELLEKPESNKLARELQDRLVQCCLDFINDKGIDASKIDRVIFTADSLQESAKYGSWQACTDSTCELETWTDDGFETISFSA